MRKFWLSFLALVMGLLIICAAIGWYFSGLVLAIDHSKSYDIQIQSLSGSTVTLSSTADSRTPGEYGLDFANGAHLVIGPVLTANKRSVLRQLINTVGSVNVNDKGSWTYNVWSSNPGSALALKYEDVDVPTPLGLMPAWYLPARSSTWVVAIHGRDETRAEAFRVLPILSQAGLPVLDITYRNDVGAAASTDHADHLGGTEWQDVESAMTYAKSRGAQNFVLYGWSMGGALAMQTLRVGPDSALIKALILDDPVMDWRATLDSQGSQHGLPLPLTRLAEQIYSWRTGFSFKQFDQNRDTSSLKTPILILHGMADTYVPGAPTRQFGMRSNVSLYSTPLAKHTGSWNVDQADYDNHLQQFLAALSLNGY